MFHTVGELRNATEMQGQYWATFQKKAGVYCIFEQQGATIRYIGMSERDTGTRLYHWFFNENKVSAVLADDDIVLSVVLEEQPYMAPALEAYLITKLKPILNVRGMGRPAAAPDSPS